MRKGLFWLSLVGLASCIGYVLTGHPPVFYAVAAVLVAVTLCGASWVWG